MSIKAIHVDSIIFVIRTIRPVIVVPSYIGFGWRRLSVRLLKFWLRNENVKQESQWLSSDLFPISVLRTGILWWFTGQGEEKIYPNKTMFNMLSQQQIIRKTHALHPILQTVACGNWTVLLLTCEFMLTSAIYARIHFCRVKLPPLRQRPFAPPRNLLSRLWSLYFSPVWLNNLLNCLHYCHNFCAPNKSENTRLKESRKKTNISLIRRKLKTSEEKDITFVKNQGEESATV